MATYYALPTLSLWGTTSGWSLTSGGADAGVLPGSGDPVVFDTNSGPARTISLATSTFVGGFQNTSGRAFTFTSSGTPTLYVQGSTGVVNFSNCTLNVDVQLYGSTGGGTRGLLASNAVFQTLSIPLGSVTLQSDLVVQGQLSLASASTTDLGKSSLASGAYNVTLALMSGGLTAGGNKLPALNMGSGIWTVTGNSSGGTWWDTESLSSFIGSSATLVFRSAAPAVIRAYARILGGQEYGAIWNDCKGTVSLNLKFSSNAGVSPRVKIFKASPGSISEFDTVTSSLPLMVDDFQINGSGTPTTLRGNSVGTNYMSYIRCNTEGVITMFYAALSNLTFSGVANWRAARSTNGGSLNGVTFVKESGSFLPFF